MTEAKRPCQRSSEDTGGNAGPKAGGDLKRITTGNSAKTSRNYLPGITPFSTNLNNNGYPNDPSGVRWMEHFALMAEIAGKLLSADASREVFEKICLKVMAYLDCQVFFNYLVDDKTGKLHLNSSAGIPEAAAGRLEWLEHCATVSSCAGCRGGSSAAEHLSRKQDPCSEILRTIGIKAYVCYPLTGKGGKCWERFLTGQGPGRISPVRNSR